MLSYQISPPSLSLSLCVCVCVCNLQFSTFFFLKSWLLVLQLLSLEFQASRFKYKPGASRVMRLRFKLSNMFSEFIFESYVVIASRDRLFL